MRRVLDPISFAQLAVLSLTILFQLHWIAKDTGERMGWIQLGAPHDGEPLKPTAYPFLYPAWLCLDDLFCSGCLGEPKPNFMKLQQIISSIIVDWKLPFILHLVYWLDTGSQLVPEKFRCFGGPTTEVEWCEITQISSIVFSSLTFLGLLVACYSFQRNKAGLAGQLASCISFWSFLPLFELVIVAGAIVPKLPPSR